MSSSDLSPKVGLQVLIVKDGKILVGIDGKKGERVYGVPAGHWENGETDIFLSFLLFHHIRNYAILNLSYLNVF